MNEETVNKRIAELTPKYPTLNPWIIESLVWFALAGRDTGDTLRAFLANDLMEAVGRSDHHTLSQFREIAMFIYNAIPVGSHGSYKIVDQWAEARTAEYLAAKDAAAKRETP